MRKFFLIIILFVNVNVYAQHERAELLILEAKFKAFEYEQVINLADSLLTTGTPFEKDHIISIYELKAVAHFSQNDLDKAFAVFIEILDLQPDYQPDPKLFSPKIIDFFNGIKNTKTKKEIITQTITQTDTVFLSTKQPDFKRIISRSLLLPGTGHLAVGKKGKGAILTTVSAVSLGGMIDSIVDCHKKQRDYMAAIQLEDIAQKYDAYNSAYHSRNFFLVAYSLVWLYSQADLLLLEIPNACVTVAFSPHILNSSIPALSCSIQF